jgi:hypothetical protein
MGTSDMFAYLNQDYKENCGAPFIIAFLITLMVSAGMLASGSEAAANEIAVYAYYLLVVGVALQLAAFIKCEREKACPEVKPHSHDGQS